MDPVKYHLYADDTQLYESLDPGNKTDVSSSFIAIHAFVTSRVEHFLVYCIDVIRIVANSGKYSHVKIIL